MIRKRLLFISWIFSTTVLFNGCSETGKPELIRSPVISGYFADPTILIENDIFYVYATIDPWGGDSLALFKSTDFKSWERIPLNWPTKAQCSSPTSNDSRVWAPSVVKGSDGKYHMFISVGSEVYAGISESPEGPWRNVKPGGGPLISTQKELNIHTIDAEAFIDTDGQAYLYWGSGWDWKDGHCLIAKLNDSLTDLVTEPLDITPPNYFEAPYMLKNEDNYFLMYSQGKCTDETYMVRVSVSATPYGPWEELTESPLLSTTNDKTTLGPGHHTLFRYGDQHYILYHRIFNNENTLLRELAIDSLNFDQEGNPVKVIPRGIVTDFIQAAK